jgi:hypothetical protein
MKPITTLIFPLLAFFLFSPQVQAKSTVLGDIILLGNVERSGARLTNDTSLFAGDSIHTQKSSGGVLRVARGRIEIGELTDVEVVSGDPLKVVLKTGSIAFNFPSDTFVEIVTPQLEIHAIPGSERISGSVTAEAHKEDRVQSRSGSFTILEREKDGSTNRIKPGEILVASLQAVVPVSTSVLAALPLPQGPLAGPQIATVDKFSGDVRVARSQAPNNYARVTAAGLALASGDWVKTLQGGGADIVFTDTSNITLTPGTIVQIQEQAQPGGLNRRISQFIGNLWFNIQRVAGNETTLETPTAVAAIRGTQGIQDVPNDNQSTHALNEGVEQITEVVTQQSVTITAGQQVTAIRGVGFTPIAALLAAITQPVVGGGPAGGGGGGAGGVAGVTTGAATGVATVTTVSTIASAAAAALGVGSGVLSALIVPLAARSGEPPASPSTPLNPPGGG